MRSVFISTGSVVVGIIIVSHPTRGSHSVNSISSCCINDFVSSANSPYTICVHVVDDIIHEYSG
jgi:hypothetical protein